MQVANALYPSSERLGTLMADRAPHAIVMLNLLKFRRHASYDDGRQTTMSGRDAYNLYGQEMRKIVEREGGRFLFAGDIGQLVIGEVDEMWDVAALVEYPSAAEFARIATLPEVAKIGVHRAAGLEGQLLIRVAPGLHQL